MIGLPPNSSAKPPLGVGGRLFISLFFLFFFSLGSIFVWLVARESWAGLRTWTWSATDCEIIRSEARQGDQRGRNTGDFHLDLEYRYTFKGNSLISGRQNLRPKAFSDYRKVAHLLQLYRPGSHAICYVNPSSPNEAVLERGTLLLPLLVLFPLIFVAIGAIGIYTAWRPVCPARMVVRPISDRATGALGTRFAMLFFGIFAILGAVIFFLIFVQPLAKGLQARQWPVIPCTVISSEVKSHSGKGTTYSVDIFYSYFINDHEYRANRYAFLGGSSSGYSGKQAIVARYPRGSKAICYVNPADPTEAVLERGFTPGMWVGLLPLIFVAFGLGGVISVKRKGRARASLSGINIEPARVAIGPSDVIPRFDSATVDATLSLKPQAGPWAKLLWSLAFALFWNGLVSVFVFHVFKNWRSGPFEWFLALFLVPFVLIGLGLIAAVFYFFLALFNPRPHLRVTPGVARLGDALRVEWEIAGRVAALQKLCVRLEGREEVTYRQGDNTSSARSVFADLEIVTQTDPREMRSGSGTLTIPAQLMHSFAGQHNKILWAIRVSGEIPHWPDLNEEFALMVLPAANKPREDA